MKYRILAYILALSLLLCAIPAAATETTEPTQPARDPGYCGESIVWSFSGGVLTITGTGRMDDFPNGAPWDAHKNAIGTVIISGGITYVGAHSFYNYDSLTSVQFGNDVVEIGERAFLSCDALTVVYLPASFTTFGPSSFMGCSRLKEFHCAGVCPHFRLNCLWDTYATIYYPADRPWPLDDIIELEEAFHGRIEFLASDGTDPYDPETPPTQPEVPGEAPTEAPTVPPTTEPTVPPTTEPTAPPTTEPTVPPTTTEAPTEDTTGEVTEEVTGEVTEPTTTAAQESTGDSAEGTDAPTETKPVSSGKGSRVLVPFIFIGTAVLLFVGSIVFLVATFIRWLRGKFAK